MYFGLFHFLSCITSFREMLPFELPQLFYRFLLKVLVNNNDVFLLCGDCCKSSQIQSGMGKLVTPELRKEGFVSDWPETKRE